MNMQAESQFRQQGGFVISTTKWGSHSTMLHFLVVVPTVFLCGLLAGTVHTSHAKPDVPAPEVQPTNESSEIHKPVPGDPLSGVGAAVRDNDAITDRPVCKPLQTPPKGNNNKGNQRRKKIQEEGNKELQEALTALNIAMAKLGEATKLAVAASNKAEQIQQQGFKNTEAANKRVAEAQALVTEAQNGLQKAQARVNELQQKVQSIVDPPTSPLTNPDPEKDSEKKPHDGDGDVDRSERAPSIPSTPESENNSTGGVQQNEQDAGTGHKDDERIVPRDVPPIDTQPSAESEPSVPDELREAPPTPPAENAAGTEET